ncbi:MAG: serine protease [Rhizobacter sp.]|nr:serine protease [Rhizobacter sp.]
MKRMLCNARVPRRLGHALIVALFVGAATALAAAPASGLRKPAATEAPLHAASQPSHEQALKLQIAALERARSAVVGVRTIAIDDATSNETLGPVRMGSGVVIDADGLVLTIGYLVVEAQRVDLLLPQDRVVPARVVAYDVATGFGLLQALVPLHLTPAPMGDASTTSSDEPMMIASGGEDGGVSLAKLMARREFSGYWEYHLETALFTSPPRVDHSGAALFNSQGELLGIGSLVMSDVLGPDEPRMPGNMFVPVDLLKPILSELRAQGSSHASQRAWLGVNCVEQAGEVRVIKVSKDSPADAAGLRPGDRIERIDADQVSNLAGFYKNLWHTDQAERDIDLTIQRSGETLNVIVRSQDRVKTLRRPQGI